MLLILRADQYDKWLHCSVEETPDFYTRYPAERLVAHAAPRQSQKTLSGTLPGV
jgi:putative SOS response-associated peptidase YedK